MSEFNNLQKIVAQLKSCNYVCDAGCLTDNTAFKSLEKLATIEKLEAELKTFGSERKCCKDCKNANSEACNTCEGPTFEDDDIWGIEGNIDALRHALEN